MQQLVEFISRAEAKRFIADATDHPTNDSIAIISISDNGRELDDMKSLLNIADMTYLAVQFPDVDGSDGITDEIAGEILKFINQNKDKDFVVHCFAGISRSGAVAKFINEYLDLDITYLTNYVGYNRRVFNKLRAAAGTSLAAYYEELERDERTDP